MTPTLFGRPAALFLPASRASAVEHARNSDADFVILDLEDAVRPEDKAAARSAAVAAVETEWPMPVAIRINGSGTPEHLADVAAVSTARCDAVVVPAVRSPKEIDRLRSSLEQPILAMIETAAAVLAAEQIALQSNGLIAGTNDLAHDLRLPSTGGRCEMMHSLQQIVLAARAAKVPVFDGVYNRLDDTKGFEAEAAESHRLGFDGKTLIHPKQIAPCKKAFQPDDKELERARRLVAAASGGAERFEGEMIETMHVDAARRLLERAE